MRTHFALLAGVACPLLLALVANGCTGSDPAPCSGTGCADTDAGEGGATAGFEVASAASIALVQNAVVQVDITITRTSFDGPITATATNLPAGVAAAPLVIPAGANSGKLTLSALPNAAQGSTPITIAASDLDGKVRRERPATLLVRGSAGALDTTFGMAGRSQVSIGVNGILVKGLVSQSDGRVLVGGESENDLVVARLGVDGAIDTTFGAQGKVTADLSVGVMGSNDTVESIAISPSGNPVAAGWSSGMVSNYAVARFTPQGTLDSTFDNDGIVATGFLPQPTWNGDVMALAVIVQSDGKAVFGGKILESPGGHHHPVIARLKTNGAYDDTFGSGGGNGFFYRQAFVGATPDLSSDDEITALAVSPGDKIVGAGTSEQAGKRFFVVRLDAAGALDPSFGSGGFAQIPFPADAIARSVHVLADGHVLVSGESAAKVVVAKLDATGTLDTSFGGTGKVTVDVGAAIAPLSASSVLDSTGRVVIGAATVAGDVVLARVLPSGSLDTSFATGGFVITKLGAASLPMNTRIAQQPDGRIVAAANLSGAKPSLVALRFWP